MHIWLKDIPVPVPGGDPTRVATNITHQSWFWPAVVAIILTFVLSWLSSSISKRAAVSLAIIGTFAALAVFGIARTR